MKITNKVILFWVVLFVPFILIKLIFGYHQFKKNDDLRFINNYIGTKFEMSDFLDINGNQASIDFTKSELLVIDFWHKDCPPCVQEMKEFSGLFKGNEDQISLISISVNNYNLWKHLLDSKDGAFAFLSDTLPNWKHLVLKSNQNPNLNNSIPGDNIERITRRYQTNTFPLYLVLNQSGEIVSTPSSLVKYLKVNLMGRNEFLVFITSRYVWSAFNIWLPKYLIVFSGYFWILIIVISLIRNAMFSRQQRI